MQWLQEFIELVSHSADGVSLKRFLPLVMAIFLVFVFWGDVILGQTFLYDMDIHTEFLPLQKFMAIASKHGGHGWWNPFSGLGVPLLADGHAGIYYLPHMVFRLFGSDPSILGLYWAFHLIYCFYFTYKFARLQGIDKQAAYLSAIVFSFSGYLTAITSTFMYALSITHTPALFYFICRCLKKFEISAALLLGLIFSQQYSIGYAPFTFNTLIALGIYFTLMLEKKNLRASINVISFAALVGLLFSLPQLLPTLEFIFESNLKEGVSFEYMVSNSLNPKLLLSYIYPLIWGSNDSLNYSYWGQFTDLEQGYFDFDELHNYLGLLPLVLVLCATFHAERSKEKRTMIILGAICFILSLGASVPYLYKLLHRLPVFSFFKDPAKWSVHGNFCLSMLAAWGLSLIDKKRILLIYLLLPVILTSVWLIFDPSGQVSLNLLKIQTIPSCRNGFAPEIFCHTISSVSPFIQFMIISLLSAVLIFLPLKKSFKSLVVTAFIFVELLLIEAPLVPRAESSFYKHHIKTSDHRMVDGVIPMEVDTLGLNHLSGDIGAYYQIPTMTVTSPFVTKSWRHIQKWAEPRGMIDLQRFRSLDALVTLAPFVESMGVGSILNKDGSLTRLENPKPLAYVSYNAELVPEVDVLNTFLEDCDEANCPEALISADLNLAESNLPYSAAKIIRHSTEKVEIQVISRSAGVLVYLDQFYPGWSATLNGSPVDIQKVNGIFKGVKINAAGPQKVEFEFLPPLYVWGRRWFWICWVLVLPLFCITRTYNASSNYGRWQRREG